MADKTSICNLALAHLGVTKSIENLDTDDSAEATVCRRFYETTKDSVLRDYPWPFAQKSATLNLVANNPTTEWNYSYRYPTDCLMIRRIYSGLRTDTNDTRVRYEITRDSSGRLIYSDEQTPVCEYTMRNDDPEQYPPDFQMALSYRIAFYIAPAVTGGDPFNLQERVLKLYDTEISRAGRSSFNEEQRDVEPESELQRSRD